jgi:ribonuclease HI
MLLDCNIDCEMVEAIDNNEINRFVTLYKPNLVVIEALWVVPSKFEVLKKLHPNVTWMIRLHSEIPFLALEGIALEWLKEYDRKGVLVSSNSERVVEALKNVLNNPVLYAPNFYHIKSVDTVKLPPIKKELNVSCFGSIRPLKNHLSQAIAAIKVANYNKQKLNFHINATRKEQQGQNVYKNLKALFTDTKHELIEVEWLCHDQFLNYIKENIDIGMQVSFTETFCIVAADHITCNVPILTSPEVKFVTSFYHADPTDIDDIASKLNRINCFNFFGKILNKERLIINNNMVRKVWVKLLRSLDV